MCAIAGMIGLTGEDSVIQRMLSTMTRRGPDATGVRKIKNAFLLHARLSVIDPEGGGQPMSLRWGQEVFTIVYNTDLPGRGIPLMGIRIRRCCFTPMPNGERNVLKSSMVFLPLGFGRKGKKGCFLLGIAWV